jgi:hypothetical protein
LGKWKSIRHHPSFVFLALPTTFNAGSDEPDWRRYFEVTNKDQVTCHHRPRQLGHECQASECTVRDYRNLHRSTVANTAQARLNITIVAEEEIIEIINVEPIPERAQLFNQLFPNNTQLTDLTEVVALQEPVTNVYRILEGDVAVAFVYEASVVGFYRNTPIQLLLFVAPEGTILRLEILASNASEGYGQLLSNAAYIDGFIGLSATNASIEDYVFDSVADATRTRSGLQSGVVAILDYHAQLNPSN